MDLDLGPLNVLICWQSLLLSFCVATLTHGAKTALDFSIEGGKEQRKKKIFVNRVVLPATPIILGSLVAMFVPLHPEALLKYIADHGITGGKQYAILAAYGSCLGQFADYVWHRFSGITADVKDRMATNAEAAAKTPPTAPPAP
jgi:hypothetical protein